MEYHDQPLQFTSNHYFQAKCTDSAKYYAVANLMLAITFLPPSMIVLVSLLTVNYIYPMICHYVKEDSQDFSKFSNADIKKMMQAKPNQKRKGFKLVSLFLTSLIINVVLLMLHIFSATEFIAYGEEVLNDENVALSIFVFFITFFCWFFLKD